MPTTPTTLGLIYHPALAAHHYTEVFTACACMETEETPPRSGLLSPTARAAALRKNPVTTFTAMNACTHKNIETPLL